MATKIEFRQQCPSCEAMVPIRDRRLIGRKIDCPKCKYRFAVEDPEAEDDGPVKSRKGKKADPRGKKPEGSKNTLYIGLGLGLVAVVLLGIVGYLLFGPSGSNNTPNRPGPVVGPPPGPSDEGKKPEDQPAAPTALTDPTNLLPNDTQSVLSLDVAQALRSPLKQIFFETPGGFSREAFETRFGIPAGDVKRVIQARNEDEGWDFNVMTTSTAVKLNDLKKTLDLKRGPRSPLQGREYYLIGEMDSLSRWLLASSTKPLALCQIDDQTLVLANLPPLEKFLEANARPEHRSQPGQSRPSAGGTKPSGTPSKPEGAGSRPEGAGSTISGGLILAPSGGDSGPAQLGGGPVQPQPVQPPPGQTKPGEKPAFGSPSYLTVDPALKSLLDRLEEGGESIFVRAELPGRKPVGQPVRPPGPNIPIPTDPKQKDPLIRGVAVETIKVDRTHFVYAWELRSEEEARGAEKWVRGQLTPEILKTSQAQLMLSGPLVIADEQGNVPAGVEVPPEAKVSKIIFSVRGKTLLMRWELAMPQEALDKIEQLVRVSIVQYKGKAEMTSSKPRHHELAAALRQYVEKNNGQLPRGTLERSPSVERAGLPWPPDQRLSWMVELLPYLGAGEFRGLHERILRDKSWRDPENELAAATLVPYFLAAGTPESNWWISYPGLEGQKVAATHFVGIAGVGLDAADPAFATLDPSWEKKIGVFGYDRVTRLEDIKDGPANTIAVIQVPPYYKSPWTAGGGSTVRGVPETGSVRPFVCTEHDGKPGTFAIMADGAVRFIPEDIRDDVFKALCTINGGESIDNLDEAAPPVAGMKTEIKPVVTPAKPEPRPAPAPKDDQKAPAGWKEFSSKEGGFSVLMPGTPKPTEQTQKTPLGDVKVHMYTVEVDKGQGAYIVAYNDLPQPVPAGNIDAVLNGMRDGAAANLKGGKVLADKKITLDGHPGREFDLEGLGGKATIRVRTYLVKQRMYQVMVVGLNKERIASPEAQQFLDSFKLTPPR